MFIRQSGLCATVSGTVVPSSLSAGQGFQLLLTHGNRAKMFSMTVCFSGIFKSVLALNACWILIRSIVHVSSHCPCTPVILLAPLWLSSCLPFQTLWFPAKLQLPVILLFLYPTLKIIHQPPWTPGTQLASRWPGNQPLFINAVLGWCLPVPAQAPLRPFPLRL